MLDLDDIIGGNIKICDLHEDDGPFSPEMVAQALANEMNNGQQLTRQVTPIGVNKGIPYDEIPDILHYTIVAILGLRKDPTARSIRKPVQVVKTTFRQQCDLYWRRKYTKKRNVDVLDLGVYGSRIDLKSIDPEQQVLRQNQYELLRQGIDFLSNDCREIIQLHYYEGLCIREIVEELGMSEGTVKSRLHRGLNALLYYIQSNGLKKPEIRKAKLPRAKIRHYGLESEDISNVRGLNPGVGYGDSSEVRRILMTPPNPDAKYRQKRA